MIMREHTRSKTQKRRGRKTKAGHDHNSSLPTDASGGSANQPRPNCTCVLHASTATNDQKKKKSINRLWNQAKDRYHEPRLIVTCNTSMHDLPITVHASTIRGTVQFHFSFLHGLWRRGSLEYVVLLWCGFRYSGSHN